jgi:hypothetical protein
MRKLFYWLFLIVGIVIGLGAVGHTLAARHVHEALDQFPVEPHVGGMVYVVWYFVSGCMLVFGATIVWIWFRLRAGDTTPLFVAVLIGLLEVATGIGGLASMHGLTFFWFFVVLGGLLLICAFALRDGVRGE